jgi:hypothetical protein
VGGAEIVWLALLAGALIWGENLSFEVIGTIIWVVFILGCSAWLAWGGGCVCSASSVR